MAKTTDREQPSPPAGRRGQFCGLPFTLTLLVALAACEQAVVEGDSEGIVIQNRSSLGIGVVGAEFGRFTERTRELSLEKADRHCARFGKRARLVARNHNAYQYECFGEPTGGGGRS